ncbi:hypothetical protein TRFO_13704 [Tritrichomonas foetus]|uniref:Leucine Rich Repeat family protein n=1 Tax=Tritrichomonas foetus TaxID=1144522 RepID=A0A1J4KXA5_9EUKA|nr:hypothetical protein TRFO_13704 [Tritrichomonas foetus]|eukprot:OHT15871.1 hypothetical protein TRFO_13704 [Tritrichomonas foetus]
MEVDSKLLDNVKQIVDIGYGQILICLNVQCSVRQYQSEPTILIITDSSIFVLLKTQHKLRSLCKTQWPFVTKISMNSKSSFQVYDQNSFFQIEYAESSLIVSKIYNYLTSFLFKAELPEFSIDRSFIVSTSAANYPQLSRFLYLASKANISPSPKLIKRYKTDLKNKNLLDFASYPSSSSFSEILIDSITIGPSVTAITIPANPRQPNWIHIEKILKFNSKLTSITFNDKIDSSFYKMVDDISYSIESVKFCDSQFQSDAAKYLASFLLKAKVHSLAFCNACDFSFLSKLVSAGDMRQIKSLSLESMKNIDTNIIFKNFKGLRKLKIINSDVDISLFINTLSSSNLEKFSVISGAAVSDINPNLIIPRSLTSITFSKVRWENDSFTDTWTKFSQHQPSSSKLKLNFSGATPTDEVWQEFFEILPQMPKLPKLTKLKFESNPMKSQFIQFLRLLPNLRKLSIAGCLSQDYPALNEQFAQFLSSTSSLKELSISGNEYGVLRTSIIPILNEIRKNKSIEKLNVSNNNFGDNGMIALQELLKTNTVIHSINIIGNKIESADILESFFSTVEERKLPLHFEFPKDDVKSMRRKKRVRSATIAKWKKWHEKIQTIESEDEEKQDMSFGSSPQNDSIEDLVNGSEWKLPYQEIPEPDNTTSLQQLNNTYSLTALVQKFYTSQ